MKYVIKFELLNDNMVKVIYSDNSEEIMLNNQFNKYTKEGKMKMAFIVP